MKKEIKIKQIVLRFDKPSYDKISEYAQSEHRGLGEFVRHAALYYIENSEKENYIHKIKKKKETNSHE